MRDHKLVYDLICKCADQSTPSEERKGLYLQALEICRRPKGKRMKLEIEGFDEFWQLYPSKVSRANAEKAYQKARQEVTQEVLLSGVKYYLKTKPEYQDWAHGATWLNQKRWQDGQIQETHTIARTDWPEWKMKLAAKVGEAPVNAWFKDVTYSEGVFTCPNQVTLNWIKDRMAKDVFSVMGEFELEIR